MRTLPTRGWRAPGARRPRGAPQRPASARPSFLPLPPPAKNVILAGVKAVTLHDPQPATARDAGANFYISPADAGTPRAHACRDRLAELNPAVAVTVADGELTEALIAAHGVVVVSEASTADAIRVDAAARAAGAAFIRADVRGVFGAAFCDFGDAFVVDDVDGEPPRTGIVAAVTPLAESGATLVTCVDDERLEFEDGDMVSFSEMVGCGELVSGGPWRAKNCRPTSFEVEVDSSAFAPHVRGGHATQIKQPKTLAFRPLEAAAASPGEFLVSDFSKLDRPPVLHLAFAALDAFAVETGRLPSPWDAGDAGRLVGIARGLNESAAAGARVELDDAAAALISSLAHTAAAELSPMASIFGGVVGQEVVKAASGKFHPLHQFFYFDATETLPPTRPADIGPRADRYDAQAAVFGVDFGARLAALRVFLVGAGALGCEFLKAFALMGVGTGAGGGRVTVTDDDTIEKSNLSRQFLFRDRDIGAPKSTAAAAAAAAINPDLALIALQERVSPATEGVFGDAFWGGTNLVVNALDNVTARLYVDARCVHHGVPLLESGTLGAKCNTQCVLPGVTENYGASRDPPEKQAPMCTLHSFPHTVDHCLTYARSEFEGLLEKAPAEANAFLQDRAAFAAAARRAGDAAAREQLLAVTAALGPDAVSTWPACVAWARFKFQDLFHDRVAQLTHTFPEDAVTSTGARFWSPPKRFPTPLVFDAADPAHASLIQAAAILKARVYGVAVPADAARAAAVAAAAAAAVSVPPFVPKAGVKIETDPKATAAAAGVGDEGVDDLIAALEAAADAAPTKRPPLTPIAFEKDDDTNFHMQFVAGVANMRARNYGIGEVDALQAKLIAGKIVPAIATATALATGLVCLELYKVGGGGGGEGGGGGARRARRARARPRPRARRPPPQVVAKAPVEAHRNTFANLALPLFAAAEPVPAKVTSHGGVSWTLWDRWTIGGDPTLDDVLAWFAAKGLDAYSISCGQSLLFNSLFPRHAGRRGKKMRALAAEVAKLTLPPGKASFDVVVACEDEAGEDLDVPLVTIQCA